MLTSLRRAVGGRPAISAAAVRHCSFGTSGKLDVNGASIFYCANGSKGLPILCMPGAMGTADTDFTPQLRDLADTMQVVSYDPRGYGKSQPPERTFPLDFYQRDANDAAAVMAALGHEKYAVMGWSDGAISAVMLAAAHAPAVDRLVIFGGNAYLTQEDIDAFEATRDVEGTWSQRMKDTHYPVYGADGLQRLWGAAVDAWAGIYKQDGGDVCMAQAKSIKCPTMVLHGAKDPICLSEVSEQRRLRERRRSSIYLHAPVLVPYLAVPMPAIEFTFVRVCPALRRLQHPEWFKANIPGCEEMHILPDGKHNLHLRFADEVNALVRTFAAKSALA